MKVLIDMNFSPKWVSLLRDAGVEAVHWSQIGRPDAPDCDILQYARKQGYVVLTHDLDFGAILAATQADSPSVIQVRTRDVSPAHLGGIVLSAMRQFQGHLDQRALVSVDEKSRRVRILPIVDWR